MVCAALYLSVSLLRVRVCTAVSLSVSVCVCVSSSEGACEPASVCAVRGVCVVCRSVGCVASQGLGGGGLCQRSCFPLTSYFINATQKKKKKAAVSFFFFLQAFAV